MQTFTFTDPDGEEHSIDGPDGATREEAFEKLKMRLNSEMVEQTARAEFQVQGAPVGVRMKVGNARTPEDKLSTLQGMYPDAQAVGDNFVYTDEKGRTVQYNEPGFQFSDIAEYGRIPAEIGGGMIGAGIAGAGSLLGAVPSGGASLAGLLALPVAYGLGAEMGGQGYDMLTGAEDSRSPLDRGKEGLYSVAANVTGGTPAKTVTGLADDVVRRYGDDVVAAAKEIDAPLSLSQRTGSKVADRIENTLEATPAGGAFIQGKREKAAEAIGDALETMTKNAPGDPEATGQIILNAAKHYGKRVRGIEKRLWDKIERTFSAEGNSTASKATIEALTSLRDDVVAQRAAFGAGWDRLASSGPLDELVGMLDDAIADPPYRALKRYRTNVGSDISNSFLTKPGGSQADLKRIYGAATDDLTKAAGDLGGDAGVIARQRAVDFTREASDKLERLEKILGIPAKKSEQTIATRTKEIFGKAKSAFMTSPAKMREIASTMSKGQRDQFFSQMLQDMGRATYGAQDEAGKVFSPSTFMTNYNKLLREAPENLKLLAPEQVRQLTKLLKVSGVLKKSLANTNKSRTGLANQAGQIGLGAGIGYLGGGAEGALMGAGIGAGVPYLGARAMYSPKTAQAYEMLNKAGLLNMDNVVNKAGRKLAGAGLF